MSPHDKVGYYAFGIVIAALVIYVIGNAYT
jgi:hypothetical protein